MPGSPVGPAGSVRTSSPNLVNDATAVDATSPAHLNSTNANDMPPELVARRSTNNEDIKSNTLESITKDLDKDMNNAAATTITKTVETTVVETIVKGNNTEGGQQLNGNNDNANVVATTNGNANESDLTTSLPARGTKSGVNSNGNANTIISSTTTTTTSSMTTSASAEDSNKKQLGNNLLNHDNDVNRYRSSKLVEQSKNPFEDEDDEDEQIYEIPKGEYVRFSQ